MKIMRHKGCGGIFRDTGTKATYYTAELSVYKCDKCGLEHDSSDYSDTHFDSVEEIDV